MITEIYYNHESRTITDQDLVDISYNQAKKAIEDAVSKGEFIPTNLAWQRLYANDGDMEKVEIEYQHMNSED